jgi:hypothetical protein
VILFPHAGQAVPEELFLPQVIPTAPYHSPSVRCPAMDYRSWSTWREVGEAMRPVPTVFLQQSWASPDPRPIRPATVALAHHGNELIVYAELSDEDIFNPVREHGALAFLSGDVFEIFLRGAGEPNYFEHHITPDNITLQLCFPSVEVFENINAGKDHDWATRLAGKIPVPSQVLVQPEKQVWRILCLLPLTEISSNLDKIPPTDWTFSFCRYDYTRGEKRPILSSTSAHDHPHFHDQSAWGHFSLM